MPNEAATPLQVIETFFMEDYHLPEALHILHKWVRTAFSEEKRLSRKNLLSVLYLQERLTSLLEAARQLNEETGMAEIEETFYAAGSCGITNTFLYYSGNMGRYNAWHVFPRHLSEKEFNNPYRVFKKCFQANTITQWKDILQQLFVGASQPGSVYESCHNSDIYNKCRLLFKFVEACHLIKVRETAEKKE